MEWGSRKTYAPVHHLCHQGTGGRLTCSIASQYFSRPGIMCVTTWDEFQPLAARCGSLFSFHVVCCSFFWGGGGGGGGGGCAGNVESLSSQILCRKPLPQTQPFGRAPCVPRKATTRLQRNHSEVAGSTVPISLPTIHTSATSFYFYCLKPYILNPDTKTFYPKSRRLDPQP